MSYHISNFGQFGCRVQKYMDLDGYVPETGDEFPSFRYDGLWEPDEDEWEDFVEATVQVTYEAEETLLDWRDHS